MKKKKKIKRLKKIMMIYISKDSYDLYKHVYTKEIKSKNRKNKSSDLQKEIIKGPNFKQMISRETLDKLKNDKIPVVPYLLPTFSTVRERPIMMVVYDRKNHKINRSKFLLYQE